MLTSEQIIQAITSSFPDAVESSEEISGMATLIVKGHSIEEICRFLKEHAELSFDYLMSLTAVDWPDRFDVVYHLYSIPGKHYVTLKVRTDKENPVVPSVSSVWKAADWQEREVYDMFGIRFEGHPNLQRILLEPDWEGFPLRKDYVESGP